MFSIGELSEMAGVPETVIAYELDNMGLEDLDQARMMMHNYLKAGRLKFRKRGNRYFADWQYPNILKPFLRDRSYSTKDVSKY